MAKLTAGLMWPPLVSPTIRITEERVRPIANQFPVKRIAVNKAKAPTASATNGRNFISSNQSIGLKVDEGHFRVWNSHSTNES